MLTQPRYCDTSSQSILHARLLEKFKVFTAFYHLSELRSREDLMKGIIENLNYDMSVLSLDPFTLWPDQHIVMVTHGLFCRRLSHQVTK